VRIGSSLCLMAGLVGLLVCAEAAADVSPTEVVAEPGEAAQEPTVLAQQVGASCSGKPGRLRGRSNQVMLQGIGSRSFVYYAPRNLDPNKPAPLVFSPHGFTMSGDQMHDITGWVQLAEREGFVAIFPDGGTGVGPWNVGLGICGAGAFVNGTNNDQEFVNRMIEFAERDQCIDREHVFMSGFSMGGYFSHETGCTNPNIKAISPHSGGTHALNRCVERDLPVLIQHFNPDLLISYDCAQDAKRKWVQRNGCSLAGPEIQRVQGGTCEFFKGCQRGQVGICTYQQGLLGGALIGGHGWAGGKKVGLGGSFAVSGTQNAAEMAWNFFKQHAW
jgi:polyhydroxybutyrate depolymerase